MLPEQQQRIIMYFIEEAKDHLNTIEQGLLNLQATIEDSEMVNEVFRAAHSIKGGAAMLGFESIQRASHRLEDYFKILKESPIQTDRTLESMLLHVFDALQELLEQLQGPFGLTEDKAQEIMTDVDPIFDQLNNHLNILVAQGGGSPSPIPEPAIRVQPPVPTPLARPPVHAESSALQLVFKSDIPTYLRDMLGLFKQADNDASRAALSEICTKLHGIGEQFDLSAWCDLAVTARLAVSNQDQTYRSLATVLIKDLKKAQELVLSDRAPEIAVSDALQALLPPDSPTLTVKEEELDALLEQAFEPPQSEPDLADLFAVDSVALESDLGFEDSIDGWFEQADVNDQDLTSSLELTGLDTPSTSSKPDLASVSLLDDATAPMPAEPVGPEVGAAELNSLADLFEGEISELGNPWQEEELPATDAAMLGTEEMDLDISSDFSDLLETDSALSSAGDGSAGSDDLANLFGDVLLDDDAGFEPDDDLSGLLNSFSTPPAPSDLPSPTATAATDAQNEFDDLFDGDPSSTNPNIDQAVIATDTIGDGLSDFDDLFDGEESSPNLNQPVSASHDNGADATVALDLLDDIFGEASSDDLANAPDDSDEFSDLLLDNIDQMAEAGDGHSSFDENIDADALFTNADDDLDSLDISLTDGLEPTDVSAPVEAISSDDSFLDDLWGNEPEQPSVVEEPALVDELDDLWGDSTPTSEANDADLDLSFAEEGSAEGLSDATLDAMDSLFNSPKSESDTSTDLSLDNLDLDASDQFADFPDLDEGAPVDANDFSGLDWDSTSENLGATDDGASNAELDTDEFDLSLFDMDALEADSPADGLSEADFVEIGLDDGTSEPMFDFAVAEVDVDPDASFAGLGDTPDLGDFDFNVSADQASAEEDVSSLFDDADPSSITDMQAEGGNEGLDMDDLFDQPLGEPEAISDGAAALEVDDLLAFEVEADVSSEADLDPVNNFDALDEAEEPEWVEPEGTLDGNLADLMDGVVDNATPFSSAADDDDFFGLVETQISSPSMDEDDFFSIDGAATASAPTTADDDNFFDLDNSSVDLAASEADLSLAVEEDLSALDLEQDNLLAGLDGDLPESLLEESLEPVETSLGFAEEPAEASLDFTEDSLEPAEVSLDFTEESLEPAEMSLDFTEDSLEPVEVSLDFTEDSLEPFDELSLEFAEDQEGVAASFEESIGEFSELDDSSLFSAEDNTDNALEEFEGLEGLEADLLDDLASIEMEADADAGFDADLDAINAAFAPEVDENSDFDDLDALLGAVDLDSGLNALADINAGATGDEMAPMNAMGLDLEIDQSEETPDLDFDDLESLLEDDAADSVTAQPPAAQVSASVTSVADDGGFDDLDALLAADEDFSSPAPEPIAATEDEFGDLERLLEEADQTLGGSSAGMSTRRAPARPTRRGGIMGEQTMRVSVKHLDNLSNLVGELVVNRNSLEQDQERLRQFLDNLLFQVQQLNDVGQRMRDLYERSLLESSLIASRQAYQLSGTTAVSSSSQSNHSTGETFDALEMDRFTGFHTLSQEMIELIVRVRESSSDIAYTVESSDQTTRQFRQVTNQLQDGLNKARMVPFGQTADRLPRAVRDISIKCGKEARLVVEGRDTLIDKMILEQLYDPMTHLVNNAITHGVETPEMRAAAGKPREGVITVRAFYQGNQTVIYVADDGAGINPDFVKEKAVKRRLISPEEAKTMSVLDVYELLFHPGFSTRDKADDFAGRGVGMDVVRTALSEVRGSITIDSEKGKGTSFTIRLPLTLSISKALSCLSNQARIAFPMDGVEDMFDVPRDRIQTNEHGQACVPWRDSILPFQPLAELLKYNRTMGRGRVYGGHQDDDVVSVVVLRSASANIGLEVDQVIGEQEIVIKQLEGPVPKPLGIAGATVLGDGRVMPIADVLELIDLSMGRVRRDAGTSLWSQGDDDVPDVPVVAKTEPTVLIVDDSITVRELLSMSFNKVGYRVEQARDGQEAWEKLRSGLPCDLVFCDIEMPRMDGLELLSRMQKDSQLKTVPIAMLTSRGADRHRQMAVDLGASGYFTKPYLEEALLDAAQRMLNGESLVHRGPDAEGNGSS